MCYFEQKYLLMSINSIFIYLSVIFIYFLHTYTCRAGHKSDNQLSDSIRYVAIQIYGVPNIRKKSFLTGYPIQSVKKKVLNNIK